MNKSIKQNVLLTPILLFFTAFINYALKLALNTLLTRHLTPALYGDLYLALRILILMATFCLIGTKTSAVKFLSPYLDQQDYDKAGVFIRWNIALLLKTILLFVILLAAFTTLVKLLDIFNIKSLTSYHLAFYLLWLVPIVIFALLLTGYLLANKNTLLACLLGDFGQSAVLLIAFAFVVLFLNSLLKNNMAIMLVVSSEFVLLFIIELIIVALWLRIKKNSQHAMQINKQKVQQTKDFLKKSLTFVLNDAVILIFSIVDMIIIEVFGAHENSVGLYAAVLLIVNLIWVIQASIHQFIQPQIAISNKSSPKALQNIINTNNSTTWIIPTIISVAIILFSNQVLGLFGSVYTHASTCLVISVFTALLGAIYHPMMLLVMLGKSSNDLPIIKLVSLILLVAICIPLTYFYSIVGTACATLSSGVFLMIGAYILSKRQLPHIKTLFVI